MSLKIHLLVEDTWHELYRGTQVGLTGAESPEFSVLGESRLLLETNGKTIRFDIEESGSGVAFKRLMSGLGRVAIPVTIDSFIDFWEFPKPIAQTVPVNQDTSGSDWKAGSLSSSTDGVWTYLVVRVDRRAWSLKEK